MSSDQSLSLFFVFTHQKQIDAFNDVMSLVSSTATAEPSFSSALLLPDHELQGLALLSHSVKNPGRDSTMAGSTFAGETTSNPRILKTPTDVRDILVEALRISCLVPLSVSSPDSIGPEPPCNSEAWKDWERWERTKAWDMGASCREELMRYCLDLLETFCWREGNGNTDE